MADDRLIVKAKKAKGDDGYRTFSIRIKEDTISKIERIAADTGRSRNELIGMFLEYAAERCEIDKS
jgi:predicted transcriptional regulator